MKFSIASLYNYFITRFAEFKLFMSHIAGHVILTSLATRAVEVTDELRKIRVKELLGWHNCLRYK